MADHKDCTLFPSTVFILSVVLHSLYIRRQNKRIFDGQEKKKLYNGSCHCNAVQFQVKAPVHLVAWNCNCSVCFMKKNWHFIVPEKDFTILKGEDQLTTYQFNTKVAKHKFCRICGVQAYYHPRSNPDGVAVTLACLQKDYVTSFEVREFDGVNWETFIALSDINKFSEG